MPTTNAPRRPPDKNATVSVVYNGRVAEIAYQPQQVVQALLAHSLNEFQIVANREAMRLFNAMGAEVPVHQSVRDAGVEPGDQLILRQITVGGG